MIPIVELENKIINSILKSISRNKGEGFIVIDKSSSHQQTLQQKLYLLLQSSTLQQHNTSQQHSADNIDMISENERKNWEEYLSVIQDRKYIIVSINLFSCKKSDSFEVSINNTLKNELIKPIYRTSVLATQPAFFLEQFQKYLLPVHRKQIDEFIKNKYNKGISQLPTNRESPIGTYYSFERLMNKSKQEATELALAYLSEFKIEIPFEPQIQSGMKGGDSINVLFKILKDTQLFNGAIFIVSGLSDFIKSKESNSLVDVISDEIRYLQFLGEKTLYYPFWMICLSSEKIEAVGKVEPFVMSKIKELYKYIVLSDVVKKETEDEGQKTEKRKQETESKGHKIDDRGQDNKLTIQDSQLASQNILDSFIHIYRYLSSPYLHIPDEAKYSELIRAKERLMKMIERIKDCKSVPDNLLSRIKEQFINFREAYIAHYGVEHQQISSLINRDGLQKIKDSIEYKILTSLSKIKYISVVDSDYKINRLIDSELKSACDQFSSDDLRRYPMCHCGFLLGTKINKQDPSEIQEMIVSGIMQYISTIQNDPLYRKLIDAYISDFLLVNGEIKKDSIVDNKLIDSIISIINMDLTVDTSIIIRKLSYYLSEDVVRCFNKIFENKIAIEERSLSELFDDLSGRTYTPEKILDIVRKWIGSNKGLIKIVE